MDERKALVADPIHPNQQRCITASSDEMLLCLSIRGPEVVCIYRENTSTERYRQAHECRKL
jgi:hypothetical protein